MNGQPSDRVASTLCQENHGGRFIISTENKSSQQIKAEAQAAFRKFQQSAEAQHDRVRFVADTGEFNENGRDAT